MTILSKILLNVRRALRAYAVFAILNVIYKTYASWAYRRRAKLAWKHLPGRDTDPFATGMRNNSHRLHDFFASFGLDNPGAPLVKMDTSIPSLMVNTPEAIQWMLKDEFENVTKPHSADFMFALLDEFLGSKGIFVLKHGAAYPKEDPIWHKERKVSSKIFTQGNFNSTFYSTFVDKGKRFLNVLEKKQGQNVDVQELFYSFTMDSIEKFFLGKEVNTVEGGMSEYAKSFDSAHQSMIRAFTSTLLALAACKFILPFPLGTLSPFGDVRDCVLFSLVLKFNPNYQNFKREIKKLDDEVFKYIKQTRSDPNVKNRKDIIANFLNSKIGNELDDVMLRDIVLNLTIAGRDTTAGALSWMMFELTQNLDVQDKLYEELYSKFKGRVPEVSELSTENLPYLNGVIYETLRLHPPVPTDTKQATKDLVYLDGTKIPKHTLLSFCPMAAGRNPEVFKDPLKFDPNRWIPFHQPTLFEFPVFQAGPRFCLGKDMAQLEMKLLVSMIFQNFRMTLVPGEAEKVRYTMMLTQGIANDEKAEHMHLWCIPEKRQTKTR